MDVERETDRLFELDPGAFVAARDDLARRLRAAGDRDAAGAVAGLRRPSVAAWVVNRLVRERPERFEALLAAGGALEQAQRRVLSGLGGGPLRAASERRRALLDELRREAARTLREAGRGESHADAAVATLEAASVDPDAAREVGRARLERELPAPSGFGGLGGLTVVRDSEEAEAAERAAAERRQAAEERKRGAQERLAGARQAVRDAERGAAKAERDRAAAQKAAAELERQARAGRVAAERTDERASAAAAELERARAAAERIQAELAAAELAVREDTPAPD